MQASQAPRILPSDFPLTSTDPPFATLFISVIYGFIILTLHLPLYFLLTQPFFNVISILRSIAPPKDLQAFTTSKSITGSNINHRLAVLNFSLFFPAFLRYFTFPHPLCLLIFVCAYICVTSLVCLLSREMTT